MIKKLFSLGMGLTLALGCAASLKTNINSFDKTKTETMGPNFLSAKSFSEGMGRVQLNPLKITKANGKQGYQLELIYQNQDWLFIRDALEMMIDGEVNKFHRFTKQRHVKSGAFSAGAYYPSTVIEKNWYIAQRKDIERLATAKEVKVKVSGRQSYVVRHFNKNTFQNYKTFLEKTR